ncbi:MAG: hypothetical protein QW478_05530 [Candidatus Micrarchaeaceae archaeon]
MNTKTVMRIMKMNNLVLTFSKHKNSTGKSYLTKPDLPNRLWGNDVHYISRAGDAVSYLISIRDCFSKQWISNELSGLFASKDFIKTVEKAYAMRFQSYLPVRITLRTDNSPQYTAREFSESMKLMGTTIST